MTNAQLPLTTLLNDIRSDAGGMLLIDKPQGWTSFDVVNRVRRLCGIRKAGHAGTLDPLATGLLILCTGKKTREIDGFMAEEKEYRTTMFLGAETASYDAETPIVRRGDTGGLTGDTIAAALQAFVGPQTQIPPMYSAAKVNGRRLYKYAHRGEVVERRPRSIEIRSLLPVRIAVPEVEFDLVCTKGTYVRTLVHDIGQSLGCGAYVTALRRTRIGAYRVDEALTIDRLAGLVREVSVPAA
jgi:tRNA pseudouridine55 synthase